MNEIKEKFYEYVGSLENLEDSYKPISDYIKELEKQQLQWISVKDKLPANEIKVIAFYYNSYGKARRVAAQYISPRSVKAEDFLDSDCCEDWVDYDEENDIYWTPDGWYEYQEATDINYYLDENITHWMPLPDPPEEK